MLARLLAAFSDPLLGWWIALGRRDYARYVALSLAPLICGFFALFHPPALSGGAALAWLLAALLVLYAGFGLATIAHHSWGAALSKEPSERVRVTAMREGCGLVGVIGAAGIAGWLGYDALTVVFSLGLLGSGALLLLRAPRPAAAVIAAVMAAAAARPRLDRAELLAPFKNRQVRALFTVLIVNGVAAAIPATLFLFFAEDRLKMGNYAGMFLIVYFAAAAGSLPLWAALARRYGEARAWFAGMVMAALVFVWAYFLGPGAMAGFAMICLVSGIALGADLALPPALLAGVIARGGDLGRREAAYFGWWNWGVQMNLALAAGIVLPLLAWLGYVPGQGVGLGVLSAAYAVLPCILKLVAALILWRAPLRDC